MTNQGLIRTYLKLLLEDLRPSDLQGDKNVSNWISAAWKSPETFLDSMSSIDTSYLEHVIKPGSKFDAMAKVAIYKLGEPLGLGSSRLVFELSSDKVIKIANNDKGIEQNTLEAVAGQDPVVDSILAKVLDYDQDFSWLVSEKITPLKSEKEFEEGTGLSWNDLRVILGKKPLEDLEATVKPELIMKTSKSSSPKKNSCHYGEGFRESIQGFLKRYDDLLAGDILKFDSWGKTSEGCTVLLDYGITNKKFKQLYR